MTRFIHNGKVIKAAKRFILKRCWDEVVIGFRRYTVVQMDATLENGERDVTIKLMTREDAKKEWTAPPEITEILTRLDERQGGR